MAPVRVALKVEVDQKGNGLSIRKPVPLRVVYERDCWRAECDEPRLSTEPCESMERAVLAGARRVAQELQAAVVERPIVAGTITPDCIPEGMF